MKIAICDDTREIRTEIADIISSRSPEAKMTEFTSAEALLRFPEEFDIIFLDIAMEGITGLEAAKLLREKQSPKGGKKAL